MNDDQQTTPAVDPASVPVDTGTGSAPVQPPVGEEASSTPNQTIAEDALNNAPLTPAAPADTEVGPAVSPPVTADPAAPVAADPTVPAAPAVEDPAAPVDPNAGQTTPL